MADEARSIKSRSLLNVVMEDIKTAERRLAATQDRFLDLEDSIATIGVFLLTMLILLAYNFVYSTSINTTLIKFFRETL